MYHLSIPFPCQVQVKDYEETLCMQGTEEFIIVLEMYPGPGLWHVWRASATLDILSYLVHSSELMSTHYWPQSLEQVSKVVLALIICCQPDQIITQCIRYSVRSRGSLALTRMSMSKHSFHFPGSCSWRLKIEKIRIILQISSDPGVEVFLVQKPDMDLYRWYPRGSLNHNKVETNIFNQDATCKMNVNTHILPVSSPIWSWNVDVGLFLHMQTIVSLLIQVMCSEHSFLRTDSGEHSMWSSPSKQCRGWVPPPGQESGCLDPHCFLTPENWEQRKESMLRSIFVYLTSYQCHESSMASGFAGSKSLLRPHSEFPSVKTSAKS